MVLSSALYLVKNRRKKRQRCDLPIAHQAPNVTVHASGPPSGYVSASVSESLASEAAPVTPWGSFVCFSTSSSLALLADITVSDGPSLGTASLAAAGVELSWDATISAALTLWSGPGVLPLCSCLMRCAISE